MDRRGFLKKATQTTAASAFAMSVNHGVWAAAPQKQLRVGLIGCGWYGKVDLLRLLQVSSAEVVGLCDVDQRMLNEAADIVAGRQKSGRTPRTWSDYRQMLAKEQFDIVLVDTPDHWHALPMIDAVNRGIDVWVQKPTAVDVVESHAMLTAARKNNRVVQVGMQRRSTPHLIEARDRVVNEGLLGDIGMVEVYCYYHMRSQSNPQPTTPPEGFDYEMWTGPAPMRPYTELIHPRSWRAFMEYSNGILGDMCVHMYDMVRWMLKLGWPSHVTSSGGILVQTNALANTPDTQTAIFQHPDFPVVWQHRSWGAAPDPEYPWGATIYGDKGTLKLSVNKYEFTPRGNGQKLTGEALFEYEKYPEDRTEKDLERHVASAVRGHMQDFLHCIESREKPVSDIEQGHISTSSCILANMAMKLQRTLAWDPVSHQVINDEEANQLLRRKYRSPWIHPEPV
ncbi:MAG: Gfo/Idh/MocA family oxidoreductase [Planctomycetaceae bacterium]|nr:Gfo/Idh/MocA family oxidoreductase [Planctomycetaceae bacterium]